MQMIKRTLILFLIGLMIPISVRAGSISFNSPEQNCTDKYTFNITTNNLDLNYISGVLNITNGAITNITMANGWINKTGNNNEFYFYYDGISKGSFEIATIEVTLSGDSTYRPTNLKYGVYKCQSDKDLLFGESGNIVDASTYNSTCRLSKDATLKSLSASTGSFTTSFNKNNFYYNLKVSSDVKTINFKAITNDAGAKVISGESCDITNNKQCEIVVESSYGNKQTYYVSIIREQTNSKEVTNFNVVGGSLTTEFKNNVYLYTIVPNSNSSYIYFTFNMNGTTITSDKCSTLAETCNLKINDLTYVFNISNDDSIKDCTNNNVISSTTTTTSSSSKKSTSTSKSTTSSKKTTKKNTTSSKSSPNKTTTNNDETTTIDTENDTDVTDTNVSSEEVNEIESSNEEETIDPVEYNKTKEENNSDIESRETTSTDSSNKFNNKKNLIIAIIICGCNVILGFAICCSRKKHK